MCAEACSPYTEGFVESPSSSQILPESQSSVNYADEDCISARPHREKAREEISDYVLMMLGAPVVRIELDIQQVSLAVDIALKKYEQYAPRVDFEWYYFTSSPGQSRYKLPCDIGIIREVVFRAATCGKEYTDYLGDGSVVPWIGGLFPGVMQFGADFGGSGAYGPWGYPSYGSLGEWAIFKGYQKLFRRLVGAEPSWDFAPDNTLILFPNPTVSYTVGVNYMQRRRDWKNVEPWIKEYALAHAKQMLGRIRSKFERYVTPSGGVALDGQTLLTEGATEKTALEQQLIDRMAIDHMLPAWG